MRARSTIKLTDSFTSPLTGFVASYIDINIYVWEGAFLDVPSTPTYTFRKFETTNVNGNAEYTIDQLIKDYITYSPQVETGNTITDSRNQINFQKSVIYYTTNPQDDGVEQGIFRSFADKGFNNGYNPSGTDYIRLSGDYFKVSRRSKITAPITNGAATTIEVKSFPNNEIDIQTGTSSPTTSDAIYQNVNIDLSTTILDTYIEVTTTVSINPPNTKIFYITDTYKNEPLDVVFFNRYGQQQTITFFDVPESTLNTTKETFNADTGLAIDGFHNFVDYNVQGRRSVKLGTGFIYEETNPAMEDLFLSDKIYIRSTVSNALIPVNIKNKTFVEKTSVKDKLVNYEVEFEMSYNEIQNV